MVTVEVNTLPIQKTPLTPRNGKSAGDYPVSLIHDVLDGQAEDFTVTNSPLTTP